ncbi:MAG: hypothetical protein AAFP89_20375 [Bacteroidota bacterium]
MKRNHFWSTSYVLCICTAISLFMFSCEQLQEEEIIPLEDAQVSSDISNYHLHNVVLGDDGNIIGYLDIDYNLVDKEGNLLKKSSRDNFNYNPKASLYQHSKFKGSWVTFFNNTSSSTVNITYQNLLDVNMNDKISSVIVPPYCNVRLYEHPNNGGNSAYFGVGGYAYEASYRSYIGNSLNDKTSSIRVQCSSSGRYKNWCGQAYEHSNYGGDALALYYDTPISYQQLKDWGWNDRISSIGRNSYGRCSSVTMTEHQHDRQKIENPGRIFTATGDWTSLPNFNDKASSIIPDGRYRLRSRHLGMSGSTGDAVAQSYYDEYNSSTSFIANEDEKNKLWCENLEDQCNLGIDAAADIYDFGAALACPGVEVVTKSIEVAQDISEHNWINLAADVIEDAVAAAATIVEAPAWIAAPEVKAAACYVAVGSLAAHTYSAAQCQTGVYNPCMIQHGLTP